MFLTVLQFLIDPRVLLGLGVLFFGGIIALGEFAQARDQRKKPSEPPADNEDA